MCNFYKIFDIRSSCFKSVFMNKHCHRYCMFLQLCNDGCSIFRGFIIAANKIVTRTLQQQWQMPWSDQQCVTTKTERKRMFLLHCVRSLIIFCFESAMCVLYLIFHSICNFYMCQAKIVELLLYTRHCIKRDCGYQMWLHFHCPDFR